MEDIAVFFPQGADFLIAHHVLEHVVDPINTLVTWFSYVKDDGLVIISISDKNHCDPKKRLLAPIEHFVLDYLLAKDEDSFESREHIYSFLLGWSDLIHLELERRAYIQYCLNEATRSDHDLHWHALDRQVVEQIIHVAGLFSGNHIEMITVHEAITDVEDPIIEALFVFKKHKLGNTHAISNNPILPEVQRIANMLIDAGQRLNQALARWP